MTAYNEGGAIQDFARRTLKNYELIHEKNEGYEVTQAINSLLGLIIFPVEVLKEDENLDDEYFSSFPKELGFPDTILEVEDDFKGFGCFLYCLQCSVAHSDIKFTYYNGEIQGITLIIKECSKAKDTKKTIELCLGTGKITAFLTALCRFWENYPGKTNFNLNE